jgi:hypothetical protein
MLCANAAGANFVILLHAEKFSVSKILRPKSLPMGSFG